MLTIELAGAPVVLLAERALYLPDHRALLVADVHIGKALAFRRLGVPVPAGTTTATLDTLEALLQRTGATQLVFLGDLLHSAKSRAPWPAVTAWRERHAALRLTLVRGNHDRHAGDPPCEWGVDCVDEPLRLGPFALAHHPEPVEGAYVLAGHVHPAALVGRRGAGRLRLPCFHFGPAVGVLPAFGGFTGTHVMPRAPGDRVYVIADDAVRGLNSAP